MTAELLPCPFCGGKALITAGVRYGCYVIIAGCEVGNCPGEPNSIAADANIERAMNAWNRRAK